MFYPSLSLFSLGLVDSSSRLISSAEGAREKRSRGSTRIALCLSLFLETLTLLFHASQKKNTSQKVFLFCLAREKEHASARCTRDDDDANDDNERAVRESERFVFSPALFVFISVRGCVFNSNLFGDCR